MDLQTIVDDLHLTVLTAPGSLTGVTPSGGYASDLLSCVMAQAAHHSLWVTLQAHGNVVAVAALLDLSAVILAEGAQPEPGLIEKARVEGVTLLATPRPTFEVVGRLWALGLRTPT
ncbi:MAG: hypothetical protein IT317_08635 [Anaerolineales bacterium]|nr:hypothetical protein [Anaerolineales bacterium]